MGIFRKSVVEVDPLDKAIDQGRSVRGFLGNMVSDLTEANRLHEQVKEDANNVISQQNARIEIANQEQELNTALVTNLRNTLGLQD